MRTLKSITTHQVVGVTVGLRKNGDVAVLLDDEQIIWYSSTEFSSTFEVV